MQYVLYVKYVQYIICTICTIYVQYVLYVKYVQYIVCTICTIIICAICLYTILKICKICTIQCHVHVCTIRTICVICTIRTICAICTIRTIIMYAMFVLCAGDVVAVRTFGDQVVTEHNMVPPDGNLPSQQPQTLTADLDMFSLECASCEDAIPAIFEYADSSARMYTVLSDHALSVFIMPVLLTGGQVTLTQVGTCT